ncbi:MAG: CoA pyrophosphatase [Acidobacteriota bacterium]
MERLLRRFQSLNVDRWIAERLSRRRREPALDRVDAAVLMLLQRRTEGVGFVLTRRTQWVATHKGQICFPGGVREPGDRNLVETALRECYEEIGLEPGRIRVLGEFKDYRAVTGHGVRTVPAWTESGDFSALSREVAYVLWVPVAFFLSASPRVERRPSEGGWRETYHFDYRGEDVWGLTARMIVDFLTFLGAGEEVGLEEGSGKV